MTTVFNTRLRVRRKSGKGDHRQRTIDRWGYRCWWCDQECDPKLKPNCDLFPTLEHLIRKSDGGDNHPDNLRIACRKCNNTRHAHEPVDVDRAIQNIDRSKVSSERVKEIKISLHEKNRRREQSRLTKFPKSPKSPFTVDLAWPNENPPQADA